MGGQPSARLGPVVTIRPTHSGVGPHYFSFLLQILLCPGLHVLFLPTCTLLFIAVGTARSNDLAVCVKYISLVVFFNTELVSLWGISKETGCAGCR